MFPEGTEALAEGAAPFTMLFAFRFSPFAFRFSLFA